MKKITIRREKIFGRPAFVILNNGKPTQFRFTKTAAENFARKIRKRK